jgi:hypothetical protein
MSMAKMMTMTVEEIDSIFSFFETLKVLKPRQAFLINAKFSSHLRFGV